MVYYKPEGVSIIADATLVSPHKNSKSSLKVPYEHHNNERCKRTRIKVVSLNNLNEQYDCLADNFDENPARNHQIRLATVCPDVIWYIRQHLTQLFVFFTDHSLVLMKQAK
jgi:hypothetical protein